MLSDYNLMFYEPMSQMILKADLVDLKNKYILVETSEESRKAEDSKYIFFNFKDVILLRDTGILDSDGDSINEGDILNIESDGKKQVAEVVFNTHSYASVQMRIHNEYVTIPLYEIKKAKRESGENLFKITIINNVYYNENAYKEESESKGGNK